MDNRILRQSEAASRLEDRVMLKNLIDHYATESDKNNQDYYVEIFRPDLKLKSLLRREARHGMVESEHKLPKVLGSQHFFLALIGAVYPDFFHIYEY